MPAAFIVISVEMACMHAACASWVFLLCAVSWIISWHFGVPEEERVLLEKYGSTYREYMDRTPRWIGIPKSSKNKRED